MSKGADVTASQDPIVIEPGTVVVYRRRHGPDAEFHIRRINTHNSLTLAFGALGVPGERPQQVELVLGEIRNAIERGRAYIKEGK